MRDKSTEQDAIAEAELLLHATWRDLEQKNLSSPKMRARFRACVVELRSLPTANGRQQPMSEVTDPITIQVLLFLAKAPPSDVLREACRDYLARTDASKTPVNPQLAPAGQGDDQSPFPPPELEEIGKARKSKEIRLGPDYWWSDLDEAGLRGELAKTLGHDPEEIVRVWVESEQGAAFAKTSDGKMFRFVGNGETTAYEQVSCSGSSGVTEPQDVLLKSATDVLLERDTFAVSLRFELPHIPVPIEALRAEGGTR